MHCPLRSASAMFPIAGAYTEPVAKFLQSPDEAQPVQMPFQARAVYAPLAAGIVAESEHGATPFIQCQASAIEMA